MIFFGRDNYKIISNPDFRELKRKYANTWKDDGIPQKQWPRVERQMQNISAVPEFRALVDCVQATKLKNPSILEIGCSSGYLSEVLMKAGIKARYEGTDYSPSFIRFAKQKYPDIKFTIDNATNLHYKNNSFDIVISGCCLLHIINYPKAIAETERVARKFAIFHRTPILHSSLTSFLTKTAYGAEMLDIYFNEDELIDLFYQNDLAIIKTKTISQGRISGLEEDMVMKNYLCRKL